MTGEDSFTHTRPASRSIERRVNGEPAYRLVPALLLAVLVVLAPVPFGAANGWALSALEVISLSSLGLLLALEGSSRVRRTLAPLLLPLGLLAGLVLVQLIPMPLAILHWLSPTAATLYRQMLDSSPRWLTLSIDAHGSVVSLLRVLGCAAAFLVAAVAPLPGRGSLLYWAVMLSGTVAGAIAWWHAGEGWGTLLFGQIVPSQEVAATDRLHWPLLNPNHLAALLNVAWLTALGGIFWPAMLGASGRGQSGWPQRAVAAGALAVALSALVGTRSRGGMGSAAAGLAVLLLLWPARGRVWRSALWIARGAAVAVLLGGVAWLGWEIAHPPEQGTVLAALDRHDATLQVRIELIRQSLQVLRDFPALGTGLGTWGDAFPRYQRYPLLFASMPHLHCDPLEWLSDLGALGFALLLVVAARYAWAVSGAGTDDSRKRRAILAAAVVSLLVHAAGDFALRVPAIALGGAVLLGLLWRDAAGPGTSALQAAELSPRGASFADRAVAVLGFALLLYLCTSDWREQRVVTAIAQQRVTIMPANANWNVYEQLVWQRLAAGESGVEAALRAVTASPLSAKGHRALAHAYHSTEMRERELRRAVACEPANRYGRIEHAVMLTGLGQFAAAQREVEEAFYLDPQYGNQKLLELPGPDESWPFLEAALRGMRRRVAESPEVRGELERFELTEHFLRAARERKRRGP